MSHCPMVFHQGGYILFGGYIGETSGYRTSTVARFDELTRTWSKVGSLLTSRSGHGVIYTDQSFLVIGGLGADYKCRTEKCHINNASLSCKYHSATLENFNFWPATVLVNGTLDQ